MNVLLKDNNMGCDIHLFIEYKEYEDRNWYAFSKEVDLSRSYEMFGAMAGVRNYKESEFIAPRGLPDKVSDEVLDHISEYVSEGEGLRGDQKAFLNSGESYWIGDRRVSIPDYHSVSWLNVFEYEKIFKSIGEPNLKINSERIHILGYKIVLDIMKNYANHDIDTRIVFFFDN